ncbi:MAG: DNA cytosine methyltransferase [Roseovarius sp.]|nr:DNA cytosine methyltransferase [Roseovarius sp.]
MTSYSAVDLFCGSGGLSLGAQNAGAEIALGVDHDVNALGTFRENFGMKKAKGFDLSSSVENLCETLPSHKILLSGPPCQSFSTSNQRTRTDDNPLNNLLFVPADVAARLQPEAVVVENVHGLGIGSRQKYLEKLVSKLERSGYSVSIETISGDKVGLPQNRTRLFIIGLKKPGFRLGLNQLEQATVSSAISDLPLLENGANIDVMPYGSAAQSEYAISLRKLNQDCSGHLVTKNASKIVERYSHVPQGGNWKSIPLALMAEYEDVSRCHTGIYHRLISNKPAKVVGNFRKNMLIHPTQDRGLSIREAARLQSFPDDYNFVGSIGKRQQQVGNAVPPLMAEAVVKSIIRHLED